MNDSERLDMIETWRKKAYQNSHSDLLCRLQTGLFEIMQAMISTDPHSQSMQMRIQALSMECKSAVREDQTIENDEERALHYGMLTSVCQLFTFLSREGENGLSSPQSNMQNESSHSPLDTDIFNEVMESAARHAQKKKEVIARRNTFNANPKDLVKKKLMKTVNFDQSLLTSSKYDHKGVFDTLEPEEFTMEYYQSEGLEKVLIFDCKPEELGMKIPPNTFTPRDVMERVGENRMIQFINVDSQQSYSNSFKKFVEYFEEPVEDRAATYNVISLEVSGTEMVDLVQAPELVRQVDLASRWPDARKQRKVVFDKMEDEPTLFSFENKNPRVEHFCLMSASASYTGFHIDFHGSSVWYHVLKGEKVFFIIEPTNENIKKYEKYLLNEDDDTFFGDHVEKCTRVVLKAGNTLILPAGWIHAVFTPVDTLVFGGNFIHPRSLKMQMKIVQHEDKLKLQKTEKYPQADEVFLHYMDYVVEKVTARRHIRPTPRNRQNKGLMYVGEKYLEEKRHHIIPNERDFNTRRRDSLVNQTIEECPEYEQWQRILENYHETDFKTFEVNDFLISEDPRIFYHPEHFGVEATLKGSNPCGLPLSSSVRALKIEMDEDILGELIHPSEIVQWEALLEVFLKKKRVNLPEGLTRPNSLVYSFFRLLNKRRAMEFEKDGLGEASYQVPERTAKLNERWNEKIVKNEQKEESTARITGKQQSQIGEASSSTSNDAVTEEEIAGELALSLFAKRPTNTGKKNKSAKASWNPFPRRGVESPIVTLATPKDTLKEEEGSPTAPSPTSTPKNAARRSQAVPKLLDLDTTMNAESPSTLASPLPIPSGIGSKVQHRKSAPTAITDDNTKAASRRRSVAVVKQEIADDEPDVKKARMWKASLSSSSQSSPHGTTGITATKIPQQQKPVPRLVDSPQRSAPFASMGSIIGIKPSTLAPYSPSASIVSNTSSKSIASPKPSIPTYRSRRSAAIAAEQAIADTSKATDDVVDEDGAEVVLKRDPQIRDEADSDFDEDSEEEEDEEDHDFRPDFHEREAQRVRVPPSVRPACTVAQATNAASWSKQEVDILVKICLKYLINQCDLNSPQAHFTSSANIAEIRQHLPHRTDFSIKNKIADVKQRPNFKKLLEDFKTGKLVVPDVNNN